MLIERLRRSLPVLMVWTASAAYVGPRLDRGWIPRDEGTLGQAAERVLAGDLPHRDFDDVYTGGLARFDAAVFRVLGTRLIALRQAMFGVFLLWIPAVFYIARRFVGPWAAAGVTLLCVVWSIPTYSAAMPSWYNLFFATFGTAALIRFTETRRRRWLIAAGIAGGLSLLVKVVGLYYIAAALLLFAFDEQRQAAARTRADPGRGSRTYAVMLTAASICFVLALFAVARSVPGLSPFVHFVLPGAMLVGVLIATEWRDPPAEPWTHRVHRLLALVWPFALGAALPIALFLYPYVTSGSVAALVHGVFIAPVQRLHYAVLSPPSLRTIGAAFAWLLVLIPPAGRSTTRDASGAARRTDRLLIVAYGIILAALAVAAAHGGRAYVGVWLTVCYVAPAIVAAGCWLILTSGPDEVPEPRREQLWLLLCMTAMCSLVQVPFAQPFYNLYFAPIAILALLAIITAQRSTSSVRPLLIGGFFLIYGLTAVNPGHVSLWDGAYTARATWPRVPLPIARTGLLSGGRLAAEYERVVALLDGHSAPGGFIYAAPDAPELYFLAQRRNPTRTLYDFFDDSAGHARRVIRAIDSLQVTAVAINRAPMFSRRMDSTLARALSARFSESAVVEDFVVRWRTGH